MGFGIKAGKDLFKKVGGAITGSIRTAENKGVDTAAKAHEGGAGKAPVINPTSTDKGVNKLSTADLKFALENARTPEEREKILAELAKREQEKAAALAVQQPQQAQQSGNCGGKSNGGCCGKSGGCNGIKAADSTNKVDKQSAMQNLYIAEKNLQAAGSNSTNPFAAKSNGFGDKEQAQQAYKQAKAIAQQAGVSDEEYQAFKQQKQQEENQQV